MTSQNKFTSGSGGRLVFHKPSFRQQPFESQKILKNSPDEKKDATATMRWLMQQLSSPARDLTGFPNQKASGCLGQE
jgi:hypothetical protein